MPFSNDVNINYSTEIYNVSDLKYDAEIYKQSRIEYKSDIFNIAGVKYDKKISNEADIKFIKSIFNRIPVDYYTTISNKMGIEYVKSIINLLGANYDLGIFNKSQGIYEIKISNYANANYRLELKNNNIADVIYEIKIANNGDIGYLLDISNKAEIDYRTDIFNIVDLQYQIKDNLVNSTQVQYNVEISNKVDLNYKTKISNSAYIYYDFFEDMLILDFFAESSFNSLIDHDMKLSINSYSSFNTLFSSDILITFVGSSEFNLDSLSASIPFKFESVSDFHVELKKIGLSQILMILSPDLDLLSYLETYNDFIWNRRWRNTDDFELSIYKTRKEARYLRTDNYIAFKRGDIIHAGRISDRDMKKDNSNELITVSGKGLGEIFENRIAFNKVNAGNGYDNFTGPAESAMKYFVDVNVVNPDDITRKVEQLVIEIDRQKGETINYNARFQKISEILYEIAKTTGLGWDVQLDLEDKKFIFKVLSAKIKMGVRLNPNMNSVKMIGFKEHKSSSENTILIAGQGQGAERDILEVSRNEVS